MLEQFYRLNQAVGVNIQILPDGEAVISACEILVKNNQLDITAKVVSVNSVEELSKKLPPKSNTAINLSGKGILQKQVARLDEIDQSNFAQILPNANFDDFYIQNFVSGEKSFVSIIRRTDADNWITLIKKLSFTPLILSLGPFPVQNVLQQLNIYGDEIILDGHCIALNDNKEWINYGYKTSAIAQFPLKIESEAINEKLVIPYAAAFQLIMTGKLTAIHANNNSLATVLAKHLDDLRFKAHGVMILMIFFCLLLINFFVLSGLNSSNIKLANQVSASAQNTGELQKINEQVQNDEVLLKDLGWDGGINEARLIDQLAALLPSEISWRELTINPKSLSTGQVQKALQFDDHKIRVTGTSENIIPVNEWIARAKTLKWVKNIKLDSYTFNSELNTGQFIVVIEY